MQSFASTNVHVVHLLDLGITMGESAIANNNHYAPNSVSLFIGNLILITVYLWNPVHDVSWSLLHAGNSASKLVGAMWS